MFYDQWLFCLVAMATFNFKKDYDYLMIFFPVCAFHGHFDRLVSMAALNLKKKKKKKDFFV